MLRYADRTTILLCVCPSGQKKVRKPFAGVELWMWFHCGWVENWLWSATAVGGGWWVRRPTVGEETRWWVRRPDGGCCPRRCQVNSCCCSNAGLNQPPSLHPSYHPPTCLPLPECVFLLVYLLNCFSAGLVFYLSQLPKLSGCVQLNFSFGYIEFRSSAYIKILFFYKGAFNTKLIS